MDMKQNTLNSWEQHNTYEEVLGDNITDMIAVFVIRYRAGPGKQFVLNAISAKAPTRSKLFMPCAASGFTLLNRPIGLTFHSSWAITLLGIRADSILQSNRDREQL